ncbi:MAG: 5-formyltetrahydrofolate cyclo-ligase [Candidatus Methylomirabilales bacterium]
MRRLREGLALKIGLAFDFQVVDRLPVEARDVPVDCVVTESRMIEAGRGREAPPRDS